MTDPTVPEPAPYSQPIPPLGGTDAPTPTLSIISMILGILGLLIGIVGGGLLFSVGGVVLGHLGQRKEPAAKGFWLTGLITGYVGILLNVVVIVVWIIFFITVAATGDNFYYGG
ncbi:hypothetical protein GCM10027413_31340 [Conyzicola nivalis]|uniref:DUF4190 domain-containing protein n=1 Tax=Conyzicola nivalis TaxID=1477021 RepID=A0A916ST88_9MICO|nr:hypothetical protein [Conyzicola nivalis]GGB12205.1 hypothetical protein GCM10010979_28180 [Conyzicola nivalis]